MFKKIADLGFYVVCMMVCASTVLACIQTAIAKPQIKHIYFPVDQPGQFPQGDWKPIPYIQLQEALQANNKPQPINTEISNLEIRLFRSNQERLTGELKIKAANFTQSFQPLNCKNFNASINELTSPQTQIVYGNNIAGELVIMIPPGESTLKGKITLPIKHSPNLDEINITLPNSINANMLVETELNEILHSNLGIVKLLPERTNNKLIWSVSAGARQELQLRISKQVNLKTQAKSYVLLDEQQTWNIAGSQTNLIIDIKPDVIGVEVNKLAFIVPEKLVLQSVSLLSGGSLNYTITPQGSDSVLTIDLPEAVPGAFIPVRLRFVVQTVLDQKWILPQIKPLEAMLQRRNVILQIKSPLSLNMLNHPGYEQKSYTTEVNVQDQFQFQWLHSTASMDVELTHPSQFPNSTTIYLLNYEPEIVKIQGLSQLSYRNVAAPLMEFKVPNDYILYDLKTHSLQEENNQVIGWRLKSKQTGYNIYEVQLHNPPEADSKLLVEWLVSVPNSDSYHPQTLKLPCILDTNAAGNLLVHQSPLNSLKFFNELSLPLSETSLSLELWPPEFKKYLQLNKSDKVYTLPDPVDSLIHLNMREKDIVQQYLEQELSITHEVKHSYKIPVGVFPDTGRMQLELQGLVHNLEWKLQLNDGNIQSIFPEKEIVGDRAIYTFSFLDYQAAHALNLQLEIKHPLIDQISTFQISPRNLKQPLPLRLTLNSDLELSYELTGSLKPRLQATSYSNAQGKLFELPDACSPWFITIDLKQTPQLVSAPITELSVNSVLYQESVPKLEHTLSYNNLSAQQLANLLEDLPKEYTLCSVRINQDHVENTKSLIQKLSHYHQREVFKNCQIIVQQDVSLPLQGVWRFKLDDFLLQVHTWEILLSLPDSISIDNITGQRLNTDSKEHTQANFTKLIPEDTPFFPDLKLDTFSPANSLLKLSLERDVPARFQAFQSFTLAGYGATAPEVIEVNLKSNSHAISSLVCQSILLFIAVLLLKRKQYSWGMILSFTYLFLACSLWWLEFSIWGIVLFTAGLCGLIFPDSRWFELDAKKNDPASGATNDLPTKLKKHSSLLSPNALITPCILLCPMLLACFQQLFGQEPVLTISRPVFRNLEELLKLPSWDVVIPFTGNSPTTPTADEVVYISAELHQALVNQAKALTESDQILFNSAHYSCELELDGSLRITSDINVLAPANSLELKVPFAPKEITLAGLNGCLIDDQTASISSQADSFLILRIPPEIQKQKLEQLKLAEINSIKQQNSSTNNETKWLKYKLHLDFYPKPVVKSNLSSHFRFSIPTINDSQIKTNLKSQIFSGALKTACGEFILSNKLSESVSLGNLPVFDMQLDQQSIPREFLDLELHMITLWDTSPIVPEAHVFLEISGIEQNLKGFNLPLPANIRLKNIYGNELESYQVFADDNPSVQIKLQDGTRGTTYVLFEFDYLNFSTSDAARTIIELPTFQLPILSGGIKQALSTTSRQLGVNPPQGYRLQEILPEQSGYAPVARDMLYRASPLEFPLTALKETDLTRTRWEAFIIKPPFQLYRVLKDEPFKVELLKIPQSFSAELHQQALVNKDSLEYVANLILPPRSTPYYHLELHVDPQIQLESATLKQQGISKGVKWSHHKSMLNIYFEDRPGEGLTLSIKGKRVLSPNSNAAAEHLVFQPSYGSQRLVLETNQLTIINQAPELWETSTRTKSTNPPSEVNSTASSNLPSSEIIALPQLPEKIRLISMHNTSLNEQNENIPEANTYTYIPNLKHSNCQWTHLLQSLNNDRISGVSVCQLDSEIPLLKLSVNEKYLITSINCNGKPLTEYSKQGSMLKIMPLAPGEVIQYLELSWELKVVPHKYFEWPEIIADSPQLTPDAVHWIWSKSKLTELKPNRKLELQNQSERSAWLLNLKSNVSAEITSKPLNLVDYSQLKSQAEAQQLIFVDRNELKSRLWVNNTHSARSNYTGWLAYIFLLPCMLVLAIFTIHRLGILLSNKHAVLIWLTFLLMIPCFLSFPAHALISWLLIILTLLYRFINSNEIRRQQQGVVLKFK